MISPEACRIACSKLSNGLRKVLPLEDPDPRVGERPHDRHGVVGGAVVGDDELVSIRELLEDRRDLPRDESRAVERRHADRDHATIVLAPAVTFGGAGRIGIGRRGYNPAMPDDPVDVDSSSGGAVAAAVDVDALFQSLREEVRRSGADPGGRRRPGRPPRGARGGRAPLAGVRRPLAAAAARVSAAVSARRSRRCCAS